MSKKLSSEIILKIIDLRQKGYSLPEIKRECNVGYGSIYRYIKDVKILPEYQSSLIGKRGGSKKRKLQAEKKATQLADNVVKDLSEKEKILFLSALYWGEGSKGDFGLCNSDPDLIRLFIEGIQEYFGVSKERLRVSIRIYEDMNIQECLEFWARITSIEVKDFVNVTILKGKKEGKLAYGMCRVRVTKGGDLLKYILAIKNNIVKKFIPVA